MKKAGIIIGVIVAVILLIVVLCVSSYNGLVSKQAAVEQQQANVQTNLQRRADLIPNLVSTVKGYAAHEEEVLTAVTEARAAVQNAGTFEEQTEANAQLDSALSKLMVVVEAYPDLKANENFIALQDSLEGTENRIAVARTDYNEAAQAYNKAIKTFPSVIFANMFGFEKVAYFEASESAQTAPTVSF